MSYQFKIGDLVKFTRKNKKNSLEVIYIINDCDIDFDDFGEEPMFIIQQIYPFDENFETGYEDVAYEDELTLHEPYNTKRYKSIMEYIHKEKFRHGMFEDKIITQKEIKSASKNKSMKGDMKMEQVANYEKFHSYDEGLDILNDVKILQDMFPDDEEYMDLKNKVMIKLKDFKPKQK